MATCPGAGEEGVEEGDMRGGLRGRVRVRRSDGSSVHTLQEEEEAVSSSL